VANLLIPAIELPEDSPEVKSYIYQLLSEFEPYITPETIIAVVSKDPMKLAIQYEAEGKDFDKKDLRSQFRISITLTEEEAKLSAEGLAKDIFTAIRIAKDSLLKQLQAIQDKAVSQQEHNMAIHHALQNTTLH
jgi:ribosome-associated translation inhibitor RaiA